MRPSEKTLQALARLANDSDFMEVMNHLRKTGEDRLACLVHERDPVELHRLQGSVELLQTFFKTADNAAESLRSRQV